MTYDMRGSWSKITGHHTNLLKPENGDTDPASVEHSVKIFKAAGMPQD
jgi:GH18 family chitinase